MSKTTTTMAGRCIDNETTSLTYNRHPHANVYIIDAPNCCVRNNAVALCYCCDCNSTSHKQLETFGNSRHNTIRIYGTQPTEPLFIVSHRHYRRTHVRTQPPKNTIAHKWFTDQRWFLSQGQLLLPTAHRHAHSRRVSRSRARLYKTTGFIAPQHRLSHFPPPHSSAIAQCVCVKM